MKSIYITDEWKKHGLKEGVQFATLTDIIYKTWAGKTAKEYKEFKGLKKENLRDNMTNKELVLNMLAELSTKEISESKNPQSFGEHIQNVVDKDGRALSTGQVDVEHIIPGFVERLKPDICCGVGVGRYHLLDGGR